MPWSTTRSNADSAVCSRFGGALAGAAQGRAGGLWGLRFCRSVESSRGGGSTRQPQRTEPCQCLVGQLWACHGALQGQKQPLQCSAAVVGPALGLQRGWASGLWGLWFFRFVEISRGGGSTRHLQRTEPCQCVSGQPWACHVALQGQILSLQCPAALLGEPPLTVMVIGHRRQDMLAQSKNGLQ